MHSRPLNVQQIDCLFDLMILTKIKHTMGFTVYTCISLCSPLHCLEPVASWVFESGVLRYQDGISLHHVSIAAL